MFCVVTSGVYECSEGATLETLREGAMPDGVSITYNDVDVAYNALNYDGYNVADGRKLDVTCGTPLLIKDTRSARTELEISVFIPDSAESGMNTHRINAEVSNF